MAGAQLRTTNDNALLEAMSGVLEDLYAAYAHPEKA